MVFYLMLGLGGYAHLRIGFNVKKGGSNIWEGILMLGGTLIYELPVNTMHYKLWAVS